MSHQILQRNAPPHERLVSFAFAAVAALTCTAALVVFNLHDHDPLTLLILIACSWVSVAGAVIRLTAVKARKISARKSLERYQSMLERSRRADAQASEQRSQRWAQQRSGIYLTPTRSAR